MDYEKFWDDLISAAKADMEYQWHLEAVRRAETDYLQVCRMLSPEQKQAIEDYIAACDAQSDCITVLAYRLGKNA